MIQNLIKRISRIELACEMLEQRYSELDYMIKTQTSQELKEYFELSSLIQKRIDFYISNIPTNEL